MEPSHFFEIKPLLSLQKIDVTSIAECENIFIIGDSNGYISFFKKENSKFVPSHNIKLKSKIEDFILIDARKILIVLSGGKLFIYDIINYADYSPKNTSELKLNDKNIKISNISNNQNGESGNEILIITENKKIFFYIFHDELLRLIPKEDRNGNPLHVDIEDITKKIIWIGNNLIYMTKDEKIIFINLPHSYHDLEEHIEKIAIEDFTYANKVVMVLELNMGIFFDLDGQALIKDTLIFKENENEYELITGIESYGNYILAFENKTVIIYDNDGKFYEKLNIDNNSDFTNKLIVKNKNKIFIATSNKKGEKSKDFKYI